MKPAKSPANPTRLRQILTDYFDEGELRTLCFDLGVDYDALPGEGKANKAREIVAYFDRRDRIFDLIELCRQERPTAPWGEILPGCLADLECARELIRERHFEDAVKLLRKARSSYVEHEEVEQLYVEALYATGVSACVTEHNYSKAVYALQEVVSIDPFYEDAARLLNKAKRLLQLQPFHKRLAQKVSAFSEQSLHNAKAILRDPVWQGVGAIVSIFACLLALLTIPSIRDALYGLVSGPTSTPASMAHLTPSPTPSRTPTITLLPTSTPTLTPTPTPTSTPTPYPSPTPCACRSASRDTTFRCLIDAEAQAAVDKDYNMLQAVFARDALVRDCVGEGIDCNNPEAGWVSMLVHYQSVFEIYTFKAIIHFDVQDVGSKTIVGIAYYYYTSGSRSEYEKIDGTSGVFENPSGSDHWTFMRNNQGCWVITRFEINASHIPFP